VPTQARKQPGRAAARLDGEQSRTRILDAAERLLGERGFSGTGIAAISRESGLPASSIYWFFSSKQDLTAAVVERAAERWLEGLADTAPQSAGGHTPLRSFFERALARSGARLPEFVRLHLLLSLEQSEADEELRERLRAVRERAQPLVAGAIAASLPPSVDPQTAAALGEALYPLAMSIAQGTLTMLHIDPEAVDLERFAEDIEIAVLAIAEQRLADAA
jgi:AcrR family transcriptional regulator